MSMVGSSEQAAKSEGRGRCRLHLLQLPLRRHRARDRRRSHHRGPPCLPARPRPISGIPSRGRSRLPDRRTAGDLRGGDRTRGPDPVRGPISPHLRPRRDDHARPSGPPSRSGTGSAPALMSRVARAPAATMEALQSVGEVTCTLGEIKNRADLIIVWRADPLESHPQALRADTPSSRPGASCPADGAIDTASSSMSARPRASARPPISSSRSGREANSMHSGRSGRLAKGLPSMPQDVESETGRPAGDLARVDGSDEGRAIRCLLLRQRSGGNPVGSPDRPTAIHSLIRDLNADDAIRLPCRLAPEAATSSGLDSVLSWRTGYPGAVSLARRLSALRSGRVRRGGCSSEAARRTRR